MNKENPRILIFSLSLMLSLGLPNSIFAQEKVSVGDKIIGSTFKALAKAFVATVDIKNLKKNNIDRLNKKSEDKFKKQYAKVYKVLKDLPPDLKINYGISEYKTKEEIIKEIESLDKEKAYKIIDSIPDTFIAEQFKYYLIGAKQEIEKSNVVQQINKLWNKMIQKAQE